MKQPHHSQPHSQWTTPVSPYLVPQCTTHYFGLHLAYLTLRRLPLFFIFSCCAALHLALIMLHVRCAVN